MKIGFVCNEYPPRPHGGIGTFVQTMARRLHQRGHQVTVVGIADAPQETTDGGIRVVSLRVTKLRFVGSLITRLHLRAWLASEVRAGRIDTIEVPDYLGLIPFPIRNCSTIVRLHLSTTAIYRQAGLRIPRGISFFEKMTLRANPNWIGVSQYILDSTKKIFGLSPRRSVKIFNPVPSAPVHIPDMPALPAKFVVYAGHVSKRKGAIVLAEAAREFLAKHPDLHLVYVGGEVVQPGEGSVIETVKQIVGTDLVERVHFLGRVGREQVLACMKRAKVFAFPSNLEALPLVVLEAMRSGVPVICTNAPFGIELVEDGVTGLLADPNSPSDFAEKIERVLENPVMADRLVTNAREAIANRFSLEQCVSETEDFYGQCGHAQNVTT
jgi:alpha-maltose-1-phosphate synthase